MENKVKIDEKKNGVANEDLKQNLPQWHWSKNITVIDLSEKNLKDINDTVKFPPKLIELNLSNNLLCDVPDAVLNLEYLKILDLSFNAIKYFDDTPNFCHTIEQLNLSNNQLEGPPYWVFSDEPESLQILYLSNNWDLTKSLDDCYVKQLLQFNVLVKELYAYNCRLNKYVILLQSYPKVKNICLGTSEYSHLYANSLLEVPCTGLDKCCDIEQLNLCNTNIYTVTPTINLYKHLKELDLSQNNINTLPNEFCELVNLEICVLSQNKLLYLPDNLYKLENLKVLRLDSNKLCMIFENLFKLQKLSLLDLYDNILCDVPDLIENLEELDLALNYFEEPENQEYLVRKQKLRSNSTIRYNGRKEVILKQEQDSEHSNDTTDDEELISMLSSNTINESPEYENRPPSSYEDWDSDEYWIPLYEHGNHISPPKSPWHYFVERKITEGNFCPIDLHPVSIAEKVRYEKLCNPQEIYELDGQFDDYSDDDT